MARKRKKKRGGKGGGTGVNKVLPFSQSLPLGIQHVLAMFAGNITVPIIIASIFGQTDEQKIFLIQMALFVAGVATIIQTVGIGKVGSRLPIIQGTSFAFIPVMAPFAKAGLGAVFTAACALFLAAMYTSGLIWAKRSPSLTLSPSTTGRSINCPLTSAEIFTSSSG